MKVNLKIIKKILFLLSLLLVGGCYSNRKNITVNISNYFWNKTVYVDVACMKNDLLDQYEICSKKEYWCVDSDLRNQLHSKNLIFNTFFPAKQVISEDAPLWKFSSNDDYLAVFADFSATDVPWKMIIPLEYYSWFNFWDSRNIYIYISKDGMSLLDKDIIILDKLIIPQENVRKYIE